VDKPSLSNDHNVYILGAGFGVEARLPLIRDFMNYMRDADLWLAQEGGPEAMRKDEREAIREVLEFRLRASAAAYRVPLNVDNIEDLFSLAAASDSLTLSESMTTAIAATLDYARNLGPAPLAPTPMNDPTFMMGRLPKTNDGWVKPNDWGPVSFPPMETAGEKRDWYACPPYQFYVGVMANYFTGLREGAFRHDTIITFNYDTLVEDSLKTLDVPFSYGTVLDDQQTEARLRILKLHGSVNWGIQRPKKFAGMDTISLSEARRIKTAAKMIPDLHKFQDYTALRKASMAPVIVPPTWQKGGEPHLADVWDDAVKALRTATRVVIIGYSIPPTDTHFKYLLAAGLQDSISLRKVYCVNPALKDDEIHCPLKQRMLSVFRREHFEQGVIEFVPEGVRGFLSDSTWRQSIGRFLNSPTAESDQAAPWKLYLPQPAQFMKL